MRWRIAISDLVGDTRLIRELLAALAISIINDGGDTFLVGEVFEKQSSHDAVRDIAKRLNATISELENDDPALRCGFQIGPVHEHRADGSWSKHHFVTLEAGVLGCATLSATLTVGTSNELSEEERIRREHEAKEREFQNRCRTAIPRFVAAFRYERALQVQQLLRGEPDPLTLGHVAEIIENDLGGTIKELVSEAQWTRFQRSINHPDVFGVRARHIVSSHEPPSKPMLLPEARVFINELARLWMLRKVESGKDG
jgi:hypothetical protein